jgi:hypothetical protein
VHNSVAKKHSNTCVREIFVSWYAAAWNVLQPFSVVNRMAMFVYQDEEGKV